MLGDTGRSGTEGIRNRFSRTFSLYDDPDTRSQVSTAQFFGRTGLKAITKHQIAEGNLTKHQIAEGNLCTNIKN